MDRFGEAESDKAVVGTVIELLPNGGCRLELEGERQVTAHAAGPLKANFVRLRTRDRVLVELSPHDRTRGRIIKLLDRS